jgi:2',3'-cyclic-nucleotide 2'-phosphodiesterase (5'-nucleotidase family)
MALGISVPRTQILNPDPSSPLLQLADSLQVVDAVLGGHTHSLYITYQDDGKLVTQSPNSGLRFVRIRFTVDTNSKQVQKRPIHKPGYRRTPDPAIRR